MWVDSTVIVIEGLSMIAIELVKQVQKRPYVKGLNEKSSTSW
ncbi:hypothetical protein CWATWH8502_1260 [Crocosphaera watsonii WH 8502]|uniref:Uncharacterized protein n=5 Tax=Crocosphaera watsonii TaxID=263511 RepID=T2JW14_CROWT|nr:hypothetical protein [Crocosphaera watsonii]EHJ13031.1 hypothetical protein CWATWH0003_2296 [Crocosphaera watsonii WH 0003]CCQ52134.1 hypothetical protein CWATWH8502_1260 [Crocosphaera watsonii WH 8502]CCQ54407.1 hypothetical protein CWATWH0005_3596 [Crocosphaera watsonii WH 0005]CCQ61089.1 hypothetical protein CWATWH0401_159 [Crocosphaera watsonii WH 0401]CCQ69269.1 hypothetical protein CWATWH0402_4003 [Crocosphaera watsonii WH 0402]